MVGGTFVVVVVVLLLLEEDAGPSSSSVKDGCRRGFLASRELRKHNAAEAAAAAVAGVEGAVAIVEGVEAQPPLIAVLVVVSMEERSDSSSEGCRCGFLASRELRKG